MSMSSESLALLLFGVQCLGFMILLPLYFCLTVFTPESFKAQFFREPYFTPSEMVIMSRSPGRYIRTAIFAWGLIFPSLIRKRGIKDIRAMTPLPFFCGCILLILTTMTMLLGIAAMIIFDPLLDAINAVFY